MTKSILDMTNHYAEVARRNAWDINKWLECAKRNNLDGNQTHILIDCAEHHGLITVAEISPESFRNGSAFFGGAK